MEVEVEEVEVEEVEVEEGAGRPPVRIITAEYKTVSSSTNSREAMAAAAAAVIRSRD